MEEKHVPAGRPLASVAEEILKCPRCGQCRAYCPVFGELHDEASVARARIALAKALLEGKLPVDAEAEHCLSECTLCLACEANCPSGVKVESILLAARAQLARDRGISTTKRAAFNLLAKHNDWLPYLTAVAGTMQDIPFSRLPENSGLRLRFPVAGLEKNRVLPKVSRRPLLKQVGPVVGSGNRGTVAYFAGCYNNYLDTNAGRATLSVLVHNEYTVVLPPEQGCCGMPMLANGVREVALDLMRRNVDVLLAAEASTVVTDCATCGSALKHLYASTFEAEGDRVYAEKAAALAERGQDLSQLLAGAGIKAPTRPLAQRVTYHDPCHLARGQGITKEPRHLLQEIPGVQYVELAEADRCCGGGGSFSFTHYELSKRINDRKMQHIAETDAQLVVSECPGCKLHLTDGIVRHSMSQKVRQVAEVLALAYGPIDLRHKG